MSIEFKCLNSDIFKERAFSRLGHKNHSDDSSMIIEGNPIRLTDRFVISFISLLFGIKSKYTAALINLANHGSLFDLIKCLMTKNELR